MKPRLLLVVLSLMLAGALLAACGGDDNKDSSAKATTAAAETGSSDTGGDSGGDSGGTAADPQIQQAIDACKQQVDANPSLSDAVKADLTKICEKAASGDAAAVQEATRDVCIKLVEESVPSGPTQDQAKAACEQATD
jgi:hypothetical protein